MKLSTNFLKEYIDIDVPARVLAEDMTRIGNEYDTVTDLIPATNLIIGQIVEEKDYPDSDHLHVCIVNIGKEQLNIVCGAPNVRKGLKVIVALPGAQLPGGTIKKGVIRGVESNGMLCALSELGLDHKFLEEKDFAGIHELDDNAPIGEDPIKYLHLEDEIIDFELTSNRGDLLSILGMAYEAGAIYNKKVKDIDLSYNEVEEPFNFNLEVNTDNCNLFLAKKALNVTIKESPEFIKNRLMASGIRPINNVVDISNYVMLETGQPLHFYDADKLGNKILVRMAEENEKLVTLDNNERELSSSDIVITDGENPVGLAGVMGGLNTEIENDTQNVLIESAIFNPTKIRLTAKKILRSEASNRYEKGIDPNRTYMAMNRACHLLEKYADAKIVKGMTEYNKSDLSSKSIDITYDKINKVLGIAVPKEEVNKIFISLGFEIKENGNTLTVTVPSRRQDISIKEDLIEEVGRIYGMDKIESIMPVLPLKPGTYNKTRRSVKNKMIDLGFNEVISYSLIKESEVHKFTNFEFTEIKVQDPMTEERSTLRYSLIPSLINVYEYNKARNYKDISIFEVGNGFYYKDDKYYEEEKLTCLMNGNYITGINRNIKVDFYVIKGILEEILDYLGYKNRYTIESNNNIPTSFHPKQSAVIKLNNNIIGYIGKLHPNVSKDDVFVFEINLTLLLQNKAGKLKYKEINKFPGISKDLAFVMDKDLTSSEVIRTIKKASGNRLKDIKVFDVYVGDKIPDNKKSLAFNLYFEDNTKTLIDEEINIIIDKIITEVYKKHNITLREN